MSRIDKLLNRVSLRGDRYSLVALCIPVVEGITCSWDVWNRRIYHCEEKGDFKCATYEAAWEFVQGIAEKYKIKDPVIVNIVAVSNKRREECASD